jgi:hypothetical protein
MTEKSTQYYDELYAAIGKFCVEFEQLCFEIQNTIMTILDKEGLQNDGVLKILLAGDTAELLRQKLLALLPETVSLNDQEKKIVKNMFSRIQKLINLRNDILHATWFIGWIRKPIEIARSARGQKYGKNKEGANTKNFDYKVADFSESTAKAMRLKSLIARLKVCLSGNYSIENNFEFKEGKVVYTSTVNK